MAPLSALVYEWIILVSGTGCAAAATYVIVQAIRSAKAAHDSASAEIEIVETSSGILRSFLPLARRLGVDLRSLLTGGRKDALYNHFHDAIGRTLSAGGTPEGLTADDFVGFGLGNFVEPI